MTTIGFWLLVIGAGVILLEGALAALWSVRLSRRAAALSMQLMGEQARLRSDVQRLRAAVAETQLLWQPYRRILRVLRHPVAIALLQSFARRRAAAR